MFDITAFWIILAGILVAGSTGLLGTFLVVRRMSMLGDAISHAVLPGIVIAFLMTGTYTFLPMFIGALVLGLTTTFLVESFHRKWKVQEDAAMGIVFTALFALGVLMLTLFAGDVHLDQECVLYGEIAYTPFDTVVLGSTDMGPRPIWILGGVFILNLVFVGLFFKELKITSFDPALAFTAGISPTLLHYLLMGAVSVTTVASFESVGSILVVALFIVPGASAYQWTTQLSKMAVLSMIFGAISAVLGYFLAVYWDSSIAGAMTVVLGVIFVISLLFAPEKGFLAKKLAHLQLKLNMEIDHILLELGRQRSQLEKPDMKSSQSKFLQLWARFLSLNKGLLIKGNEGVLELSPSGALKANELLRGHRLWEKYMNQLGLPEDHVHDMADNMEHYLDEPLQKKIFDAVDRPSKDPHGKDIPPFED